MGTKGALLKDSDFDVWNEEEDQTLLLRSFFIVWAITVDLSTSKGKQIHCDSHNFFHRSLDYFIAPIHQIHQSLLK